MYCGFPLVDQYINQFKKNKELLFDKLKLTPEGIQLLDTGLSFIWNNLTIECTSEIACSLRRTDDPKFRLALPNNPYQKNILCMVILQLKEKLVKR